MPRPSRDTTAAWSVSSTVRSGKIWTSWKLRAMPRRARATGPMPDVAILEAHGPAVGGRTPVSTLISVDFPAPFGPMIETNSPSRDAEAHAVQGAEAPVELPEVLASRIIARRSARPPAPREEAHEPAGGEDHDRREHRAEDQPPVGNDRHHRVLEVDEHEGAEHGAEEAREAAEQRHEHDVAGVGPVGEGRIDVAGGRPEQRPPHRRVHRRDHERLPAVARDAHAEALRLDRIVADGA